MEDSIDKRQKLLIFNHMIRSSRFGIKKITVEKENTKFLCFFFGTPCKYDYAFVYCSASGDAAGIAAQSAISSVCTGSDAFGDYIEVINIFGDYILR